MDKPRPRPGARKDPEVAAAEWLFQDGPDTSSTQPPGSVIPAGPVEGFELADVPDLAPTPGLGGASTSPTSAAGAGRTGSRATERQPASRMTLGPSPGVLQPWTRAAEWGPALLGARLVVGCRVAACLFRARGGGLRAGDDAPHRRMRGRRHPQLPDPDHASSGPCESLRSNRLVITSPPSLITCRTIAGCGSCSAPGDGSHHVSPPMKGSRTTGTRESVSFARGMPDRFPPWSSWSATFEPRRAVVRPRSTVNSP